METVFRIALSGVESSGKTTLAQDLAAALAPSGLVLEYARAYLADLGRAYRFEDIGQIARGQWAREQAAARALGAGWLICDTELLVCRVWSLVRFGRCDPWIDARLAEGCPYGLFLLCDPSIPWEFDPLREAPDPLERQRLFALYGEELERLGWPYRVVSGDRLERVEQVRGYLRESAPNAVW